MNLYVKVSPGAKKSGYAGLHADAVKIKIAAQPEGGKANDELIKFLSEVLNLPKSKIKISSGHTSKMKIIEIDDNITKEGVLLLLSKTL